MKKCFSRRSCGGGGLKLLTLFLKGCKNCKVCYNSDVYGYIYYRGLQMQRAFTLAEVLVTLGIIGVVAALTMPSLVGNYQKKVNIAGLKKAHSVLSQACMNIVRERGIDTFAMCSVNDSQCLGDMFKSELKLLSGTLWTPNSGIAEGCWEDKEITNPQEVHYCTVTADGIVYDFDMEWPRTENKVNGYILVDINGLKKPNKFGRDRYAFSIINNTDITVYKSSAVVNDDVIPPCNNGNGTVDENLGCAYKYLYTE